MAPVEQKLSVRTCVCVWLGVSVWMCPWSRRGLHLYDVQVDEDNDDRLRAVTVIMTVCALRSTAPYLYVTVCNCVCECMDGNVFIPVCASFCHWDSTVTQKLWHFWKQYTSTRNSQTRGGRYCFDHHLSVCLLARWLKKLSVNFHEIWGMGRLWTKDELITIWKVRIRVVG